MGIVLPLRWPVSNLYLNEVSFAGPIDLELYALLFEVEYLECGLKVG